MFKYFFIICLVLCEIEWERIQVTAQTREFKFLVNPVEGFNPCESRVIFMEREIGRPIAEENYWDGSIDLEKFGRLREAQLELMLSAPATVTVNPEDGGVFYDHYDTGSYFLQFYRRNGTYNLQFHVQGPQNGEFPQIRGLYLNGRDICPKFEPWESEYVRSRQDTDADSQCGRRILKRRKLITNGFSTNEGQWPWHAAILHIKPTTGVSSYKCGGVLISSRFVITAGHCVFELDREIAADRILVRLGQYNRLFVDPNTQEHRLSEIILHENFTISKLENDIALLKLIGDVTFTDYIQPVCLWDEDKVDLSYVVGRRGWIIGWGYTEDDSLSDVLMQARVPVVSTFDCLESNRPFFANFLSDFTYCAGYRNGTNVCNGDSGSGMYYSTNKVYRLRGIVSLSVTRADKNLCDPKNYVLFTDTAKYLGWIQSKTGIRKN